MAELADAHASGACILTDVEVQLLFPAQMKGKHLLILFTALFLAGVLLFPLFRPMMTNTNGADQTTEQKKQISITQKITIVEQQKTSVDTIQAREGETALDILARTKSIETKEYSFGKAVESIEGVKNGTGGRFWIYYVNEKEMQIGAGEYVVQPNDIIEWKFKLENEK